MGPQEKHLRFFDIIDMKVYYQQHKTEIIRDMAEDSFH